MQLKIHLSRQGAASSEGNEEYEAAEMVMYTVQLLMEKGDNEVCPYLVSDTSFLL